MYHKVEILRTLYLLPVINGFFFVREDAGNHICENRKRNTTTYNFITVGMVMIRATANHYILLKLSAVLESQPLAFSRWHRPQSSWQPTPIQLSSITPLWITAQSPSTVKKRSLKELHEFFKLLLQINFKCFCLGNLTVKSILAASISEGTEGKQFSTEIYRNFKLKWQSYLP